MSINVMSAGYYPTGYANYKTTKAEAGKTFAEIASQKSVEADKEAVQEKTSSVLNSIGSQAPDEVKRTWKEVKVETGGIVTVYRLWISNGRGQCYITKMMVDRFVRWSNDDVNQDDMLGNFLPKSRKTHYYNHLVSKNEQLVQLVYKKPLR